MKNTEKIYIGKGSQVQNYDLYNVTLNISKAEALIFEHNGEKFLKFSLTRTKQPDNYGRTHAAYVKPYEVKEPKPKKATAAKASKKAKAKAEPERIEPSFSNH